MRRRATEGPISSVLYDELGSLYQYFNDRLFSSKLPPVVVEIFAYSRASFCLLQRRELTGREVGHCLVFTGGLLSNENLSWLCENLVHEMVHLWQLHDGVTVCRSYHNKDWADRLESVGLMPSSTGMRGGCRVGYHVDQYAIENGLFSTAFDGLVASGFRFSLTYAKFSERLLASDPLAESAEGDELEDLAQSLNRLDVEQQELQHRKITGRSTYICARCLVRIWGRPGLRIECEDCHQVFLDVTGISKAGVRRVCEAYQVGDPRAMALARV